MFLKFLIAIILLSKLSREEEMCGPIRNKMLGLSMDKITKRMEEFLSYLDMQGNILNTKKHQYFYWQKVFQNFGYVLHDMSEILVYNGNVSFDEAYTGFSAIKTMQERIGEINPLLKIESKEKINDEHKKTIERYKKDENRLDAQIKSCHSDLSKSKKDEIRLVTQLMSCHADLAESYKDILEHKGMLDSNNGDDDN